MHLAVFKINSNFISYGVVHQTFVDEERSLKDQYATVIWNKKGFKKLPYPLVHSYSVSSGRFKRRLVDFFGINITRDHFFLAL